MSLLPEIEINVLWGKSFIADAITQKTNMFENLLVHFFLKLQGIIVEFIDKLPELALLRLVLLNNLIGYISKYFLAYTLFDGHYKRMVK